MRGKNSGNEVIKSMSNFKEGIEYLNEWSDDNDEIEDVQYEIADELFNVLQDLVETDTTEE